MQIYTNHPLSEILFYKIGGTASHVLKIESVQDVIKALEYVQENNIKNILPVGLGSNLLINDEGFDGAVLWFSNGGQNTIHKKDTDLVEAFSANLLDELINFSFENNLIGLEWAGGLPSSIGGAIRGNVGAFGTEIKRNVVSADIIDFTNTQLEIKTLSNEELQFSYRNSFVKQNKKLIIVSGLFKLQPVSEEEVAKAREEYNSHIQYRKQNHAVEYPSCGSVFKNIIEKEKVESILEKWPDIKDQVESRWHGKVAMGYINKRLGFSGFTVGGAQVSEKHCNYIVNKGGAKFVDVITIIQAIQEKVNKEFSFTPEPEVEIVK